MREQFICHSLALYHRFLDAGPVLSGRTIVYPLGPRSVHFVRSNHICTINEVIVAVKLVTLRKFGLLTLESTDQCS